jgi:hypothetical protein
MIQNLCLAKMILAFVWIHRIQKFIVIDYLLKFLFGVTVQLYYYYVYHFEQ